MPRGRSERAELGALDPAGGPEPGVQRPGGGAGARQTRTQEAQDGGRAGEDHGERRGP